MIWIAPLLFTFILGLLTVLSFLRDKIELKPLLAASLALPTGFSVISILLFIFYLLAPAQAFFLTLGTLTISICFLLLQWLRRPESESFSFRGTLTRWKGLTLPQKIITAAAFILFLFTAIKTACIYQSASMNNIFGGWDARFFWNVKAKFFFRSPEEWRSMFAPELSWGHPDYPLLVSASVAWGWLWTGKELQIWPALTAYSFYVSLIGVILWHVSVSGKLISGFLAAAFAMTVGLLSFWSVSQYADVPLTFFITAACALSLAAFKTGRLSLLALSGWLAACSAWTKNEGMLFLVWYGLLLLLQCYQHRESLPELRRKLLVLASAGALPLLCVLFLKGILAPHGDYLGSGRGAGDFASAIFGDPEKTKTILKGFWIYTREYSNWNGLWFLFCVALGTATFLPRARQGGALIPGLLTLLILAGYFIVLHTSPHNIVFQIQTALDRLLLHAAGPALLFIFTVFANAAKSEK